jgi:hypothetical protein
MTTFALSLGNANIWGPGADAAIALALVYGGAVQLFAGMWEFVRKNTFGALAFSSYGAFWIAYYVFVKFVAGGIPAADAPQAVGVFLLGWTIFTAYMVIPSLRVSAAVAAVFVLLTITFVLLTIGAFQSKMTGEPVGRLLRYRHRGSGLVRLVCRGRERDLQEGHHPDHSAGSPSLSQRRWSSSGGYRLGGPLTPRPPSL